ncbi:MAG: carboxynorspermidine decarboxylase [Desulfovibrionaceae bacterium]
MAKPEFDGRTQVRFDPLRVARTPAYVLDLGLLRKNLALLADVRERAGCRILLALKAFAMFRVFPIIAAALDGVCASSPHEARLGREAFAAPGVHKEVHTFAAGYSEADVDDLAATTDHLIFNSLAQLTRLGPRARERAAALGRDLTLGLRLNPEHSEGATPLYDPCAPGSRLGVRARDLAAFPPERLAGLGVTALHWHNLCEQDADCLERTIAAVERGFGPWLAAARTVNFGGGHHITRPGYDVARLVRLVRDFAARWDAQVYLEPGEAVVLNAGYLVTTVLDVVQADVPIAIMDTAVPCHMPDVLEMPYKPVVVGAGDPGEKPVTVRLAGPSCLAGDVAGDYAFDRAPVPGERLVFTDMALYTMVKNTTFNGVRLPDIALWEPDSDAPGGRFELVRRFGYADFKGRLS